MFSQPKVEEAFHNFVTARLYTDRLPPGVPQVPDAWNSAEFRNQKFDNEALPYYVVLVPRGKTLYKVAVYNQGVIDSADDWLAFLDKAIEKARQVPAGRP